MKVRITLKDPDGVYDSINDAIRRASAEETGADLDQCREDITIKCGKWIRYSEYVTIEIDTETGVAIVVPVK